jgi:hypothetical protein
MERTSYLLIIVAGFNSMWIAGVNEKKGKSQYGIEESEEKEYVFSKLTNIPKKKTCEVRDGFFFFLERSEYAKSFAGQIDRRLGYIPY